MAIYVGNKRIEDHCIGRLFYVGRPDVLGNIYSHKKSKYPDTVIVSSIEQAIVVYRRWLWKKIKEKDVAILNKLSLIKEAARDEDVTLLCWCVDENRDGACHAYIIKACIEWMLENG